MRVALADDSALFRDGLTLLLDSAGVEVVIQARTGDELLAAVASGISPDVAIVDIRMPPTQTNEGLAAASRLRAAHPQVGILVLSTYAETAYAMQVLDIGEHSMGYLLKDRINDIGTLTDALDRIQTGETVMDPAIVQRLIRRQRTTTVIDRLSEREREVLRLMAEGRSNGGIARELYLHTKTVEHYVAAVFSHLGIANSTDDNKRVLAVLTWLRTDI
jgi:DNA-binding NarL/FixJ family response regulator